MKIAVIGAGAMGSIYGGHLSEHNEVYLLDVNGQLIEKIARDGLLLQENGQDSCFHPRAAVNAEGIGEVDLVILFVKALFSKQALEGNRQLIGAKTYLMTLQNGSGHEELLEQFVPRERVIIGTTEDNGAVLGLGHVRRGGSGKTNVGMLCEDKEAFLPKLKACFDACSFQLFIHDNIQQLIWDKLFTNVSLSAVTGILQVDMGYVAKDSYAWELAQQLVREATAVARALGLRADDETIIEKVRQTSLNNPNGCTSIRADLRDGRRTEVETITGSVVRAAERVGVPAPSHRFVLNMVHAMENK